MKRLWLVTVSLGLLLAPRLAAQGTPPMNVNDWNFVLVQSLEAEAGHGNNLSVVGLNHALRVGQLLNGLLAGKQSQLRGVYALTQSGNGGERDMKPLESIQPFAVLSSSSVTVEKVTDGPAERYGTAAYVVAQMLANQPRGIYVMSMPATLVKDVAKALSNKAIAIRDPHQYVVAAGHQYPFGVQVFADGLGAVADYPRVPLPAPAGCSERPVTIHAKAPKTWRPYTEQVVYLVRHVEAHPTGTFENGNYVCQGQWRALGANGRLLEKMGGRRPDIVFTSDPTDIVACGASCSYVRPSLTVAPFAIQFGIPLVLAPFQWEDATDLAQALLNRESDYFKHAANGATILVGWEHAHIEKAVKYLFETMYQDPDAAKEVPAWSFEDYDTIWTLTTDRDGALTFRNTCEGIPTAALPSTCPAFFL
jgi:hypothetical protein